MVGEGAARSLAKTLPGGAVSAGTPLGPVRVPGSKSVTNRALLLAAQSMGESVLVDALEAEDTRCMREALRCLGVTIHQNGAEWQVAGGNALYPPKPLWMGASGTTLRFLVPWIALNTARPVEFQGNPRLFTRPMEALLDPLRELGCRWEPTEAGGILQPVTIRPHRLEARVDPGASSQFLSGLAMAAAGLAEGGHLAWTGSPASPSYLRLTAHWMERFGCPSSLHARHWSIPGASLGPRTLRIPGDWSAAAIFLCAAAVTGRSIRVAPLDPEDPQGDRAILEILGRTGSAFTWEDDTLCFHGALERGIEADLTECPDLGPVLAAVAALAPGPSLLRGLGTLPHKECDRLEASVDLVHWLGGRAEILEGNALAIQSGQPAARRPPFDPRNDHRMAFAAAVGALRFPGDLLDPACIAKTFPGFWKAWEAAIAGAP